MKKRRTKLIKDAKRRGEWVESVFMARAGEQGLQVSRPWGESNSFDFVVGSPGRFVSVQVKSTVCRSGGGYECCLRGRRNEAYARGSFDFLAAYVVLADAWYIIPADEVLGKETVCLCSTSKYAKYERYREAWQLLRKAAERDGVPPAVLESAEEEAPAFPPSSAFGRMQTALNYYKRYMEQSHPTLREPTFDSAQGRLREGKPQVSSGTTEGENSG